MDDHDLATAVGSIAVGSILDERSLAGVKTGQACAAQAPARTFFNGLMGWICGVGALPARLGLVPEMHTGHGDAITGIF